MKTLQNRSFLNKFSKYLLIGISAMVLLAGSQQATFNFVLADEEDFSEVGPLNPGEPLFTEPIPEEEPINVGEPLFTEPLPPAPQPPAPQPAAPPPVPAPAQPTAPSCPAQACPVDTTYCDQRIGRMVRQHGGYWDQASCECKYNFDNVNYGVCPAAQPPVPPAPPAPTVSCPNKPSYCIGNQTFQCSGAYYNPANRDADTDGCVRTCNPVAGNPLNCGVPIQPPQVVIAQCIPNVSQQNKCISCNISGRVSIDSCGRETILIASQADTSCGHLCAATPVVCPAGTTLTSGVCQPPVGAATCPQGSVQQGSGSSMVCVSQSQTQTAQGGAGGAGGAGGSSTVTVLAAARDSVGVGTTVISGISGKVLGIKELPKTGLPALAWTALAFIPTGFGLRRLGRVKEDAQDNPQYLWEERQFKTES